MTELIAEATGAPVDVRHAPDELRAAGRDAGVAARRRRGARAS